jgi:hypothetical protein
MSNSKGEWAGTCKFGRMKAIEEEMQRDGWAHARATAAPNRGGEALLYSLDERSMRKRMVVPRKSQNTGVAAGEGKREEMIGIGSVSRMRKSGGKRRRQGRVTTQAASS